MTSLTMLDIDRYFPFLQMADRQVKEEFLKYASAQTVPAGQTICWEGDVCTHLAIVLSGVVRVYKIGESGREITLYRIEENDSCILTASCILSDIRFPALAVVEEEVRAVLLPAQVLRRWTGQYEVWRGYIFGLMSRRMADVISTVEEIAFQRVDVRVAEFLLKQVAGGRQKIAITHQEIAFELGTAREVVSRILKDFERDGLISLSRGAITINEPRTLADRIKNS
jgi:CRP/FNR family transcriptional regulator